MGIKLSELAESTRIILQVHTKESHLSFDAYIKQHVKPNVAFILLETEDNKKVVFDNVQIDMECSPDGLTPFIWRNIKIVNYKNGYLIQALTDGVKNNRRGFLE